MDEIHILLVEDNEGDIVLTKETFLDARIKNRISIVRDGEEAINFLNNNAATEIDLLPDLILLDINLPKIDGKEVLQYIKNNALLKKIPVVILTTSSSEIDMKAAYDYDANSFISKPVDFEKLLNVFRMIDNFWIAIVKQPENN